MVRSCASHPFPLTAQSTTWALHLSRSRLWLSGTCAVTSRVRCPSQPSQMMDRVALHIARAEDGYSPSFGPVGRGVLDAAAQPEFPAQLATLMKAAPPWGAAGRGQAGVDLRHAAHDNVDCTGGRGHRVLVLTIATQRSTAFPRQYSVQCRVEVEFRSDVDNRSQQLLHLIAGRQQTHRAAHAPADEPAPARPSKADSLIADHWPPTPS